MEEKIYITDYGKYSGLKVPIVIAWFLCSVFLILSICFYTISIYKRFATAAAVAGSTDISAYYIAQNREATWKVLLIVSAVLVAITIALLIWHKYISSMSITVTEKEIFGEKGFQKHYRVPLAEIRSVSLASRKVTIEKTSYETIKLSGLENPFKVHQVLSGLLKNRT